jgi:hypothetical protein
MTLKSNLQLSNAIHHSFIPPKLWEIMAHQLWGDKRMVYRITHLQTRHNGRKFTKYPSCVVNNKIKRVKILKIV